MIDASEATAGVDDEAPLEAAVDASPADPSARLRLAQWRMARGRWQNAMDAFLELVRIDRALGDDAGRRGLLAVFELCDDPAVSIARARVAPGVVTAWRRLRDTAERYLILEGRGRLEVDGLAPAEVGPGDVVAILPMRARRIENVGDADLVFLAICTPRFVPACCEALE